MTISLEIPSEFESDYDNDRFLDFFRRVSEDIDCSGLCGNYEAETIEMMACAFNESKPIC